MKYRLVVAVFLAVVLAAYVFAIPSAWGRSLSLPRITQSSSSKSEAALFGPRAVVGSPLLWVSPAAPEELRRIAASWDLTASPDRTSATVRLDMAGESEPGSVWVYALVAPFPTVTDSVTFNEILSSWRGSSVGPFAGQPLLMDASTLAAFTALWGRPVVGATQTVAAGQLLETAWSRRPSWAIVPFESLDPRWKVLAVDGQSPIQKDFELHGYHLMQASFDYPLAVKFAVTCVWPCTLSNEPTLPPTNRDPAKMTTLVMTGVTALVRATAFTMNIKGITYPGTDIRDWLIGADIAHISNEVPFAENCPAPSPS